MALSKYEIQKKSDARRGLKVRGYKLPAETVDEIAHLAKLGNKSQAAVITEAIAAYKTLNGL